MNAVQAKRSVWVVDDSRFDLEHTAGVLSHRYAVRTFSDGSALLETLAAEAAPDVVVLDWVMPGISGVDVCRFLREDPQFESLAVLLLTAHRQTEQIVEGLSAGANDFVPKPYQDQELLARVATLVRARELLERAEQAEALNRHWLDTSPDPLLVVSELGTIQFANDRALVMLGATVDAVNGVRIDQLVPELADCWQASEPSEKPQPRGDVLVRGRRFSATLTTGKASTTVALRDVTERRLLDERRLDFYSIIAHDLRTPLHAMSMRIQYLLHSCNLDTTNPDALKHVQKLHERMRSLVAMINDFLEFASLEGASHRFERVEVDLLKLVEDGVADLLPMFERGQLTWSGAQVTAEASGRVLGDARRLAQVINNLLGNAVKFTPAGKTIGAHILHHPRHVELSVVDDGPGIPESAQATLFQRYTRAEHAVGGTGLGLMIVREIIEAHGGTVGVESTLGKGSRFWVRLPYGT